MKIKENSILKNIDLKLWGGVLLLCLLYIPVLLLDTIPERDVAYRYAPAAEAFARGEWKYAFHPRLQVLHPTFSGILVSLFSISGFMAAKLSGMFFYIIGIFPLFGLLKEVFCKKIAYWGILAYVFASRILLLACYGLRESHKQFVILLLAFGIILVYKYRNHLKGYITIGAACGLAICTRNDMILFAVVLFFICAILEICRFILPFRSMSAFLTGAVFSLPELYVNYKMTGFAIPGARFLDIYEKVFHHQPTPGNVLLTAAAGFVAIFLILLPLLGWLFRKKYCKGIFCGILILGITFLCIKILWGDVHTDQKYSLPEFFEDIFRGQFPFLFFLMLPGLGYRIFRKRLTVPEILLLFIYILHGFLVVVSILGSDKYLYVSSRYLLPAVPLYFGWIGFTALLFWKIFSKIPFVSSYRLFISWLAVIVLSTILYADSYSSVIKYYRKKKLAPVKEQICTIAKRIREDYKGERNWIPPFDLSTYYPNTQPTIWYADDWKIGVASYLAGGSSCKYAKDAKYIITDASEPLKYPGFEKFGEPVPGKEITAQIWRKK